MSGPSRRFGVIPSTLLMLTGALLGACDPVPYGKEQEGEDKQGFHDVCRLHTECAKGLYCCVELFCTRDCQESVDCPAGCECQMERGLCVSDAGAVCPSRKWNVSGGGPIDVWPFPPRNPDSGGADAGVDAGAEDAGIDGGTQDGGADGGLADAGSDDGELPDAGTDGGLVEDGGMS